MPNSSETVAAVLQSHLEAALHEPRRHSVAKNPIGDRQWAELKGAGWIMN